jgi:hypothetical protein
VLLSTDLCQFSQICATEYQSVLLNTDLCY